jgi:hypothetical protein
MLQRPNSLAPPRGELLTKTAIYRFSLAFAVFAFVADLNFFIARSEYGVAIKYAYTLVLLLLMFMYFLRWKSFDTSTLAPALALTFFFVFTAGFLANLAIYGAKVSYASAFTSSLVFATAAFVPRGAVVFDGRRILKHLLWLLSFGTVCFLVETLMRASGLFEWIYFYSIVVEPTRTVVCVLALCLAILLRKTLLGLLLCAVIGLTLVLEPKSTLFISLIVCVSLAVALRMGAFRTARLIAYGVLIIAAAAPLALYFFFDDISHIIQLTETYIKQDLLNGHSDTLFRLSIFRLAFEDLDNSFLFGDGLSGQTNVLLAREFSYWLEAAHTGGVAMIHSDFVIVLTQAGFVGYVLFVSFLYSMLRVRSRMVAIPSNGDLRTLTALSLIAVIALVIYSSFNPFLSYFQTVHPIWMLLFISEVGRKSIPAPVTGLRSNFPSAPLKFKLAQ